MAVIINNTGGNGGGGSFSYPVGDATITLSKFVKSSGAVALQWEDPDDTYLDGTLLATWVKTVVVRKQDVAPTNPNDGTIIFQETTRDAYKSTPLYDSTVSLNTTYYYTFFTQSDNGAWSDGVSVAITPKASQVMTVRIDTTNSNPSTALTYQDDATSMTAGSDAWDEWFGCYPVILAQGGTEYKKLNLSDYTKFEDGTSASNYIANTGYDVMTAFPCLGVKIWTSGNYTYVSMTDDTDAESDGYTYYAHTKGTTKKDKFYLGAYKAYNSSSKLYSHSGKTPTVNITLTNSRNYATARGTGYQLIGFYQRTFVQAMYVLKYKNLNSQAALGRGYVDKTSSGSAVQTGLTNAKGFNYGSTSSGTNTTNNRVKLFGLEDFWGNIYEWMDGCYYNSSTHLTTDPTNSKFNDSGSNYVDQGQAYGEEDYLIKIIGTSGAGFISGSSTSGSTSTYYADYYDVGSRLCLFAGGGWSYTGDAGVFCMNCDPASNSGSNLGCRICYL